MARCTEQTLQKVFAAIPSGKENAIHQTELARRLNMQPQTLKRCIKELRKQYGIIFSGARGYWKSNSKAECEEFIRMTEGQAFSRLESIKRMKERVREYEGQLSFDDL